MDGNWRRLGGFKVETRKPIMAYIAGLVVHGQLELWLDDLRETRRGRQNVRVIPEEMRYKCAIKLLLYAR